MNALTNSKGFTLLEVLISMCLLAIAMMGLATLQSRGIRGNNLGNRTTQSIALAQDKLEQLINTSRSQAITAGAENNIDERGTGSGIFRRSWTVDNNTPVANAQTITVTVGCNSSTWRQDVSVNGVITTDGY